MPRWMPPSGPVGGVNAPSAFPTVNYFCMAFLYGGAGRVAAKNGGSRPGQVDETAAFDAIVRLNVLLRLELRAHCYHMQPFSLSVQLFRTSLFRTRLFCTRLF